MLEGLARLINGSVSLTMDMRDALPGVAARPVELIDLGWQTERDRIAFYGHLTSGEMGADPGAIHFFGRLLRTPFLVASRRDVVADGEWYRAAAVSEGRRSVYIDDFLGCSLTLRPGVITGALIYRPWGAEPFTDRERRLAKVFFLEVARLIKDSFAAHQTDATNGERLSPRRQEALRLLLEGRSAKDLADGMGISLHTANQYVKEIYRTLGVRSRAELLTQRLAGRSSPLTLPAALVQACDREPNAIARAHRP